MRSKHDEYACSVMVGVGFEEGMKLVAGDGNVEHTYIKTVFIECHRTHSTIWTQKRVLKFIDNYVLSLRLGVGFQPFVLSGPSRTRDCAMSPWVSGFVGICVLRMSYFLFDGKHGQKIDFESTFKPGNFCYRR